MNEVTDGLERAASDAMKAYKAKRGIGREPAPVVAPYTNRYDRPSFYEDDGTDTPVQSTAIASRTVNASCGNLIHRAAGWECKGCGRPTGLCEISFRRSIERRQRELATHPFRAFALNTVAWRAARPGMYRTNKPITLEHIGPRPVICQNERQATEELRRHGLRSVRGPGQDA